MSLAEILFTILVLTQFVLPQSVTNTLIIVYLILRYSFALTILVGTRLYAGALKAYFPKEVMDDFTHNSIKYTLIAGSCVVGVLYSSKLINIVFATLYFVSIVANLIALIRVMSVYDSVEPLPLDDDGGNDK